MAERKAISKRTRFEIFKRDEFRCQYCGQTPPYAVLEVDHIVAVANGGVDALDNLITSCFECNRGKSNVPLSSVPAAVDEMENIARAKAEQLESYHAFLKEQHDSLIRAVVVFSRRWCDELAKSKRSVGHYRLNPHRERSVARFLESLPAFLVEQAMDIAFDKLPAKGHKGEDHPTWKYFCGICWKKIREQRGED